MTRRFPIGRLSLPAAVAASAVLAACGSGTDSAPADKAAEEAAAGAQPSPLAAPGPAPAVVAPTTPAIRTNAGPDGTTVDLTRVQVTGNVLTVELRYSPPGSDTTWVYLNADEVSVIDDASSQRLGVLQDNAKQWMAAPLSGDRISLPLSEGRPGIVWFKFPAPPAGSPTVSVNIPNVSPFDGVPVKR